MDVIEAIYSRRSVREFTDTAIAEEEIQKIIEAGAWAPSGLNNQPWKVVVVRNPKVREKLAAQTRYSRIIENAQVNLAVFYDKEAGYDNTKDILAIGAFVQNMLLAIHSLGMGACWLGDRKSTRLNSSHIPLSRMPSSA